MQLQLKLQKTAHITYLEGNKEQGRRCVTYCKFGIKKKRAIDVFKGKKQSERQM